MAAAIVDAVWAFYIMACSDRASIKAALWGATVMAISGTLTIIYVNDHAYLPTAVIGGAIGTYLTVKYKD